MSAFSYAMAAVVMYYAVLFLLGVRGVKVPTSGTDKPLVVFVVPAHNEELVLASTIQSALSQPYEGQLRVLVMNDASVDATAAVAAASCAADNRVRAIHRSPAIGGRGKGAVLNHAYVEISHWLANDDPWFNGVSEAGIVLCIVDADGRLSERATQDATAYFNDPTVGGVQIGVQIRNARESMLARMQDLEFVGFSFLVQSARDRLGSVGLGGNGQFTRLSALAGLEGEPWRPDALTEDLDLGLRLAFSGWRLRYCSTAWVDQQGLSRLRPLLRQRTRWTQGHYQCWRHLPTLLRAKQIRLVQRLDTLAYLVFVALVVVVSLSLGLSLLERVGLVHLTNNFLPWLGDGLGYRLVVFLISWLPVLMTLHTYQRYAVSKLQWWELPTITVFFAGYVYLWAVATCRAWMRALLGRTNWVKTPRTAAGETPTATVGAHYLASATGE